MTTTEVATPPLPQEVIRRKRDGETLDAEEIERFITGLTEGSVTEGQAAALAMAVFFKGMNRDETVALTQAMTRSGRRLDWSDLDGPVLDKHSTGGVGDKISLILAPILAALGAYVPMISGRGLGHTGGTLDKLDSIPGYQTRPDLGAFRRTVHDAGCAIVGQTADLAPADGRLYAIRDVTATVDIAPMIVASILSKKLAAGLDALVMDVKVGSGAFMTGMSEARELAGDLVAVANGAGLPCRALLTDMNQCLGNAAGNALEVREAIDFLTCAKKDGRLEAVTLALAVELLEAGGLTTGEDDARTKIRHALNSGKAAECFQHMAASLGGPGDLLDKPGRHLTEARVKRPVVLGKAGFIGEIDTRALGLAIIQLGGGRTNPDDDIDHRVGLSDLLGLGDAVDERQPFAVVHASSEEDANQAILSLQKAVSVVDAPLPGQGSPVLESVSL